LAEIDQSAWKRAVETLRSGREEVDKVDEPWAEVLADAVADCAADRERVLALGGLHVLGTERHEARRIDNQLRGRSGRQGDPGSSRFYISLEDELMRRFGGERVKVMMDRLGVEEGVPLEHAWLDRSIESAQQRVEGYNFDIRKHVLEYDDVVNKQREVIYDQRRQVLEADDLRDQVLRMVADEVHRVVAEHTPEPYPEDWDLRGLHGELRSFFPLSSDFDYQQWANFSPSEIEQQLVEIAEAAYDQVNRAVGQQVYKQAVREDISVEGLAESADPAQQMAYRQIVERLGSEPSDAKAAQPLYQLSGEMQAIVEGAFIDAYRIFRDRRLMLQAVDNLWVRHLTSLGDLREGIGLRAYGQQNPLVAYRKEAHEMYQNLLARIQRRVARSVYLLPQALAAQTRRQTVRTHRATPRRRATRPAMGRVTSPQGGDAERGLASTQDVRPDCDLGRNDPCWCGSGRKYKHCHLRKDQQARHQRAVASR
jgi:preprotein translocase subunit SecA